MAVEALTVEEAHGDDSAEGEEDNVTDLNREGVEHPVAAMPKPILAQDVIPEGYAGAGRARLVLPPAGCEFVDGKSVLDVLKRQGPVSANVPARILS